MSGEVHESIEATLLHTRAPVSLATGGISIGEFRNAAALTVL